MSVLFGRRSQNSLPSQIISKVTLLHRKVRGFELDSMCTNGEAGTQTIHNAAETSPNLEVAV